MAGKPTKVKGQVEEVVGIITGNKVDKTTDKIERKAGKVIDKSKGLGHKK